MTKKLLYALTAALLLGAMWLVADIRLSPEAATWKHQPLTTAQSGVNPEPVAAGFPTVKSAGFPTVKSAGFPTTRLGGLWHRVPAKGLALIEQLPQPGMCVHPDCFIEFAEHHSWVPAPTIDEAFWQEVAQMYRTSPPADLTGRALADAQFFVLRSVEYRYRVHLIRGGSIAPGQIAEIIEDHRALLAHAPTLGFLLTAMSTLEEAVSLAVLAAPLLKVEPGTMADLKQALRPLDVAERSVRDVVRREYRAVVNSLSGMTWRERYESVGKPGLFQQVLYRRFAKLAELSEAARRPSPEGLDAASSVGLLEWVVYPGIRKTVLDVMPVFEAHVERLFDLDEQMLTARQIRGQ
jgi:hypothetical protein